MIRLAYIATVCETFGFCITSRAWARVLKSIPEVDLFIIPMDCGLPRVPSTDVSDLSPYFCRPFRDIPASRKEPERFDLSVTHFVVHRDPAAYRRWLPRGQVGKRVLATTWECTVYPSWYIPVLEEVFDEIVGPCHFVETMDNPIPFGGVIPYYHKAPEELSARPRGDHLVFYTISQPVVRKNTIQAIRCFCKAFQGRSDVELAMKLGDVPLSEKTLAMKLRGLSEVVKETDRAPKVTFLGGCVSDAAMLALHRAGDIYYQPQHSEGWGIPHVEALLHGNGMVTCGFGSIEEFANEQNSTLIPYTVAPCKADLDRWPWRKDGCLWVYNDQRFRWASMADDDVVDSLREVDRTFVGTSGSPLVDCSLGKSAEAWRKYLCVS